MTDKMLDNLADGFCPTDAELFDSVYADFEKNASITPDEQSRILSSVLRKAGLDMKENITVKKTRKHSKRFVGFAIAAAVLATSAIGASAYAISQFAHRQNVERYISEDIVDKLENEGYALNAVSENEHYRVTIDTAFADAYQGRFVFTIEQLSDVAKSMPFELNTEEKDFFDEHCTPEFSYADTGEVITYSGRTFGDISLPRENENICSFSSDIFSSDTDKYPIDFSRRIKVKFIGHVDNKVVPDPLFEGIEFDLDLSRDIEIIPLVAADGTEAKMSKFSVVAKNVSCEEDRIHATDHSTEVVPGYMLWVEDEDLQLIRADGTREQMLWSRQGVKKADEGGYNFELGFTRQFIDLNDYIGVEICGIEYLRQ